MSKQPLKISQKRYSATVSKDHCLKTEICVKKNKPNDIREHSYTCSLINVEFCFGALKAQLSSPPRLEMSGSIAISQKKRRYSRRKKFTFALPKTQLHITPLQFPVLPINIAFAYSPLSFQYIPPSECFLNLVGADALNSVTANKVHLGSEKR